MIKEFKSMKETSLVYQQLIKSIEKYTSIDTKEFLESFAQTPNTCIKINPNKISNHNILDFELNHSVQWSEQSYYLKSRPAFYLDPLFYAGAYYVMDSASMFLEYILKQIQLPKNSLVLDIAAAPGGKSVVISNYLSEEGVLWSNEISFKRAKILHYNLSKWGKSNYIITNNSTDNFQLFSSLFDAVICDAPCTGSGLFRKYPEWIHSFNEQLVQQCVHRQKQILSNIFSTIKTNGYLVYSTCSFTSEENEEIVEFILDNGFKYVNIYLPDEWGIVKTDVGLRFFPHLTLSEGFFYAVFQKTKEELNEYQIKHFSKKTNEEIKIIENTAFSEYLDKQNFHQFYYWRKKYFLANKNILTCFFPNNFKYVSIGITITDEKNIVPASELAYSIYLNNNVPTIELSKNDALKFLKKENIQINAEKQIYLMQYKHLGLGWAKVLENRINNYFPTEWRILKEIEDV